jgi:hypothetical protein
VAGRYGIDMGAVYMGCCCTTGISCISWKNESSFEKLLRTLNNELAIHFVTTRMMTDAKWSTFYLQTGFDGP